jgi:hypothetical protein
MAPPDDFLPPLSACIQPASIGNMEKHDKTVYFNNSFKIIIWKHP